MLDLAGQLFHFTAFLNNAQAVAQPLHNRAGHKYAAFKRVNGLPLRLPGQRRQQLIGAELHLIACIEQQKAACTVGVFGRAGIETGLAEQGGLLVA